VLKDEFPALADRIRLRTPDEKDKRHGQAIAAASLPITSPARARTDRNAVHGRRRPPRERR
jgi:hypothetical protein